MATAAGEDRPRAGGHGPSRSAEGVPDSFCRPLPSATTLHLGYLGSGCAFAAILLVPALGYWLFRCHAIFVFWFADVMTRRGGASVADGLGKSKSIGGVGPGDAHVTLALAAVIVVLVAVTVSRSDVRVAEVATA